MRKRTPAENRRRVLMHRKLGKIARKTFEGRFQGGRAQAKYRNLTWDIPFSLYLSLIELPCYYCGSALSSTGCGLDRQDNERGYEIGNVVPCCKDCNFKKGHLEYVGFMFPRTTELLLEILQSKKPIKES